MRAIPSSLLDKIKSAWQTKHGNADPKMDIIAQKASKYLTEGSLLQPRTVRTGTDNLGALDICIRREDPNKDPTEIVMAYIEGGQAKVATLPYVWKPDELFKYKYTIGAAEDVACDFDGRWYHITERTGLYFDTAIRWALVTFGEPYISRVLPTGALTVQQGNNSSTNIQLADDNVSKVSMLRGWKNVAQWNHDQGIIVAYIRNSIVSYRNYCNQPPDQPAIWELERAVTELPSPAQNVSLLRTCDYRVGFLCESNGVMHWTITDRNWSNMGIEDHNLSLGLSELSIQVLPIIPSGTVEIENLGAGITDYFIAKCTPITPAIISIENSDEYTIMITFSHAITQSLVGHETAFIVKDSAIVPVQFTVLSTTAGADQTQLILNMANFASANGDITIAYDNGVTVDNPIPRLSCKNGTGEPCEFAIEPFTQAFAPELTPPEAYVKEHISVGLANYNLVVSFITYEYAHTQGKVSTGVTDLSIVVTKVGDNPL